MMISLAPSAKDDDPADIENTDIDTDGGNLDTDGNDSGTSDAKIHDNAVAKKTHSFFLQALLLVAAGGLVEGQLLGENDINTEPVDKAKDATKEKDSEC